MLLQSILQLFDQELARLHALREAVADLATPSSVADLPLTLASLAAQAPPEPEAVERAEPPSPKKAASTAKKGLARVSLTPRPAGRKLRVVDHGALTSSIPTGPVVVSRDRLPVKKSPLNASESKSRATQPKEGTLGSMIRALHLRLPQE